MASITLTSVSFVPALTANTVVKIEYKKLSSLTWVVFNPNALVLSDGTFSPSQTIIGLEPYTSYQVRVTSLCNNFSYGEIFTPGGITTTTTSSSTTTTTQYQCCEVEDIDIQNCMTVGFDAYTVNNNIYINNLVFSPNNGGFTSIKIEYRLSSDPGGWIIVENSLLVPTSGFISPYQINNLTPFTSYVVRITSLLCNISNSQNIVIGNTTSSTTTTTTLECCVITGANFSLTPLETTTTTTTSSTTTTTTSAVTPYWQARDWVCETEGGFGEIKNITNLYSPSQVWYDSITERAYVFDHDALIGNLYYFDPVTATTNSDMVALSDLNSRYMYRGSIDPINRKIYIVGRDSGGLITYNIDTDTYITTPFSSDGVAFNRIFVYYEGAYIYTTDSVSSSIIRFNRADSSLMNVIPVSGIPSPTRFSNGGYVFKLIKGNIYVVAGSGSDVSSVGVYSSDFTTLITEIPLPGAALWDYSKYWQEIYYDSTSDRILVSDTGSSTIHIIDPDSNTVLESRTFELKETKSNASIGFSENPITGDLFMVVRLLNSSLDGAFLDKTYLLDRSDFRPKQMFDNKFFYALNLIAGSDQIISTNAGNPYWAGTTTPDGNISILSMSSGTENTGRQIATVLEEMILGVPTGNTKPNLPSDIDYVSPIDMSPDCPISYTTDCISVVNMNRNPDITDELLFEINIPSSVRENPSIDSIEIYGYSYDSGVTVGSPIVIDLSEEYHSDSFSLPGVSDPGIRVLYLNSSPSIIQTCDYAL